MKLLRFVLVIAVLAYAGWLAWPYLAPMLSGGPDASSMRVGPPGASGGLGGIPSAWLWIGAAVLYLISALLLGAGNPRAAVAYFIGFLADAALRLALDKGGAAEPSIAARSADAIAPAGGGIDPTWVILGVLLVVGLLVAAAARRRRRVRAPGQLTV